MVIKAGNQIIDTPWLNAADSRMISAAYQGLFGQYHLNKDTSLIALRNWRFKSRTAGYSNRSNLYNLENYGGAGVASYGATNNPGAFALGSIYKSNRHKMRVWYYHFL